MASLYQIVLTSVEFIRAHVIQLSQVQMDWVSKESLVRPKGAEALANLESRFIISAVCQILTRKRSQPNEASAPHALHRS